MKFILYTLVTMLMVVMINGCSDDDNGVNPPVFDGQGYFPNGNGTYYKYDTSERDSSGNQTFGTRSSTYSGTQGTYQVQIDTLVSESGISVVSSLFRKTDDGVFYFVDTTGLSLNIPDSLYQYITTDPEIRALMFQFTDGTQWPVFRVNLNYGPLTFAPIEVTAHYEGQETITLDLTSGEEAKTAVKIRYVMSVRRDISGASSSFEAFCWLVEDIGIVKWEGNATVLFGISGGGIDFDDTTKVVTQNLIEYDVK